MGARDTGSGRARGRRREEEEEVEEERPQPGRRRGNQLNMPLIAGSAGGMALFLIIALIVVNNTAKSRAAEEQRQKDEAAAAKQANAEKIAAFEAEQKRKADEKMGKEGPWKLALEKVLPGIKKFLNKEAKMKRYFDKYSFANDRPVWHFPVRPPFKGDARGEVEEAVKTLVEKIEELQAQGYENAKAKGMPMKSEDAATIYFVTPPVGEGKKAKDGEVIAEWKNGSLDWK